MMLHGFSPFFESLKQYAVPENVSSEPSRSLKISEASQKEKKLISGVFKAFIQRAV